MTKRKGKNQLSGLMPELQRKPKPRGFRPSVEECKEALTVNSGLYSLAAADLMIDPRTLRRIVDESEELQQVVEEVRALRIDKSQKTMFQIADDIRHPRCYDANRFLLERLKRDTYAPHIMHSQVTNVSVSTFVPVDQRTFQPEAWDADEHSRFATLMAIPVHELTASNLAEIRDLRSRARIVELSPDSPSVEPRRIQGPKLIDDAAGDE